MKVGFLVLFLLAAAPALAGQAEPLDCSRCHQNPAMTPSLKNSLGVPRSLYIDPEAFKESWHYRFGEKTKCVMCHQDITAFPHQRTESLRCSSCHPDDMKPEFAAIEANLKKSVHKDLDCNDCHDVHKNKPAAEMTLEEKNAGCLKCHQYGPTPGVYSSFEPITITAYHSWHPQAALHLARMACIVCHTSMDLAGKESFSAGEADKHLILDKSHATGACSVCHSGSSKVAYYLIDVGEEPKGKESRDVLLRRIYLVGGTRSPWIEITGRLLLGLALAGVAGHGVVRALAGRRRS